MNKNKKDCDFRLEILGLVTLICLAMFVIIQAINTYLNAKNALDIAIKAHRINSNVLLCAHSYAKAENFHECVGRVYNRREEFNE